MDKIDKFWADRCGVEIWNPVIHSNNKYWRQISKSGVATEWFSYDWTIKDSRCREVCREKFHLATDSFSVLVWSCFPRMDVNLAIQVRGDGKTIAEAEMNCLQAIYKENNDE